VGNVLPEIVLSALCLAIYGMFLAIVAPVARKSRAVLAVVGIAGLLHCAFYFIPGLNQISSGISISICAIVAAVLGALLFPVKDQEEVAT
jgi:predicted branched-subunit amino acid permease